MRRMMIVFSVVAVAVLAAGAVQADPRTDYYMANYQAGLAYFPFENIENGNFDYLSPFDSPTATSQGALWLKTSATATPAYLSQDVNLQLNFRLNSGSAWTTITMVTGSLASGDMIYPGYFQAGGVDNPSIYGCPKYPQAYQGNPQDLTPQPGEFCLPGTAGYQDLSNAQFELYAWTGSDTTYAAAVAGSLAHVAGVYVADSGAFLCHPGQDVYSSGAVGIAWTGEITPLSGGAFFNMPAVILQPLFSGDANGDGRVDINDLTIVLAHYGQTGMGWAQGEFTGDGTVDINDLTIVLAQYGQTAGTSAGGISAVPEPSTLLLTVTAAGLVGLLACAWRKQK